MEAAETPFWQQLILNSVGPLVTVVVGSLVVGLVVGRITRSAQDRRTAADLRYDLITEGTEVLARMWFEYLHYGRLRDESVDESELDEQRKTLQRTWSDLRVRGEVLQHRVNAYYLSAGPGREFSLARGNLEMLINIALDRFLKSDASREYWSRIAPEHVKAFEEGNDPKRAISKEFRAHAKNFSNYVLEEPLRSLV